MLMPGARAGLACTCAGVDKEHIKSIDLVRHIAGAGVRGADIFNKRSPALPSLLSLHVHLGRLHGWLPRSTCILAHHAGTRFLAHMHTCRWRKPRRLTKWGGRSGHVLPYQRELDFMVGWLSFFLFFITDKVIFFCFFSQFFSFRVPPSSTLSLLFLIGLDLLPDLGRSNCKCS